MMKKKKGQKNREFKSFEEYEAAFFPQRSKESASSSQTPHSLGAMLARQSIGKYKHILLEG